MRAARLWQACTAYAMHPPCTHRAPTVRPTMRTAARTRPCTHHSSALRTTRHSQAQRRPAAVAVARSSGSGLGGTFAVAGSGAGHQRRARLPPAERLPSPRLRSGRPPAEVAPRSSPSHRERGGAADGGAASSDRRDFAQIAISGALAISSSSGLRGAVSARGGRPGASTSSGHDGGSTLSGGGGNGGGEARAKVALVGRTAASGGGAGGGGGGGGGIGGGVIVVGGGQALPASHLPLLRTYLLAAYLLIMALLLTAGDTPTPNPNHGSTHCRRCPHRW